MDLILIAVDFSQGELVQIVVKIFAILNGQWNVQKFQLQIFIRISCGDIWSHPAGKSAFHASDIRNFASGREWHVAN